MFRRAVLLSVLAAGLVLAAWPTAPSRAAPMGYEVRNGVIVDARLAGALDASPSGERIYAIVGFDHPPTPDDVSALEALGLTVVPYRQLPYAAVGGTASQVNGATGVAGVTSLHANRAVYPTSHSADPDPSTIAADTNAYGTGVTSVLADRAWALGVTGEGVGVAVIDTGIDTTNPSLAFAPAGPVAENVNVLSDELLLYPEHDVALYTEGMPTTDTFGHGTHVSGSVAGSGAASDGLFLGVAPGAHLVGLDGLQCAIIGEAVGCLVTILSSFDYVLENQGRFNIRVNTNSWGSGPGTFDPLDPISVAVDTLVSRGIVVLFAAGNDGPGEGTISAESSNPNAIAVAAGQPSGGLVEFSSRGFRGGVTPTIASPGHLIISSRAHSAIDMQVFTVAGYDAAAIPPEYLPDYLVAQGTSMAAPIAAGVVALIRSANPDLTVAQVRDLVAGTATPMLGYEPFEVGSGYINAEAAVRNALGMNARAHTVKLPAQMTVVKDTAAKEVLVTTDYRASIAGTGLVGFGHFAFSFPVYTDEARPIDIDLSWQTIQRYSVYTTGYRVRVYDPDLNEVAEFDTDFFDLSEGASFTIDAALRAERTPAAGAYWYMDMVNFNPGWGVLEMSSTVHYGASFRPPFRSETIRPTRIATMAVADSARPGNGVAVQGTLTGSGGAAVDGATVTVELTGLLGTVLWRGTTTSVDGAYGTWVPIGAATLPGTYAIRASADTLVATDEVTVDSVLPAVSITGISIEAPRTVTVTATALDGGGVGYVGAVFTDRATGAVQSMFLRRQADGTFSGTIALDDVGTWDLDVIASDRAGNTATASTSIVV